MDAPDARAAALPKMAVALLLAVWLALGTWIALSAPFRSGTDESISYVAFVAAKNRWATEEDFRRYGLDYFYYPPLYFMVFAPFFGDDPSFVENFPRDGFPDSNYSERGGNHLVSSRYLAGVSPSLWRLYRTAKLFSLALGLGALVCLVGTLRLVFGGGGGWWLVLAGTAPVALLPQFLYYQTLVNNDALVNALGGAAILSFTLAVREAARGRAASFRLFGLVTAAGVGMAVLTKMSGFVLAPLLAGLAWGEYVMAGPGGRRAGPRRAAVFLLVLVLAAVLAGGWWVIYKAFQGDWDSSQAHRLAHPWAFFGQPDISPARMLAILFQSLRTYFAIFSGLMVGIPDEFFMAYLLLPLAFAALAAAALLRRRDTRSERTFPGDGALRRCFWLTLLALPVFNLALLAYNGIYTLAAYGRLIFPTLVASHVLFAWAVRGALGGRRRALASASLGLTLYMALLFGWVFDRRMVYAVEQRDEELVPLAHIEPEERLSSTILGPIWRHVVEQPVILPAGKLTALRVDIARYYFPLLGGGIEGDLLMLAGREDGARVPLRRISLGDNDGMQKWTQLDLVKPLEVDAPTPAVLTLRARTPWFPPVGEDFVYGYRLVLAGRFPAVSACFIDGRREPYTLGLAALYETAP